MPHDHSFVEMLLGGEQPRDDDAAPTAGARSLLAALFGLQMAQRAMTADLQQQTGLSESDLVALGVLVDRPPAPVKELATALRLTAGSTSTLVERLTRAGMVDRQHSLHDRRVALVSITPHGAAVVADARDRYLFAIGRALEACTTDCLDTTTHVLDGITAGLSPTAPDPIAHLEHAASIRDIIGSIGAAPGPAVLASGNGTHGLQA